MKRVAALGVLALGVSSCGDGAPFGVTEDANTGGDSSAGSVYLNQNSNLVVNNISYDAANDVLTINNIPFDDPNNAYVPITLPAPFQDAAGGANGFGAYQSDPAPGSNELQYFAIFRRSDSGHSQVAAATSSAYIGFGFGGGGAQRLSGAPSLPTSGLYSYSGEYGAVRTVLNGVGNGQEVQFITGTAAMAADFGDFDDTGAVNGFISDRQIYDSAGNLVGALAGGISLANGSIDFANGTITSSTAAELDGTGASIGSGNWQGVFAGPNGEEFAGILFVDSTTGGVQTHEIGGFITTVVP